MPSPGTPAADARAGELAADDVTGIASGGGSTEAILEAAGGDRTVLEAARDRMAAQVRRRVDDFEATSALRSLNRALAELPPTDPFDWQVRWERRRKP